MEQWGVQVIEVVNVFRHRQNHLNVAVWASSLTLPTGAEVMRDQWEREARWNERRDGEEMHHCYSFKRMQKDGI